MIESELFEPGSEGDVAELLCLAEFELIKIPEGVFLVFENMRLHDSFVMKREACVRMIKFSQQSWKIVEARGTIYFSSSDIGSADLQSPKILGCNGVRWTRREISEVDPEPCEGELEALDCLRRSIVILLRDHKWDRGIDRVE